MSDRLYRVVRLAAKETGKQVRLDIVGGSIEMDRGVLDRMTPARSSTCCATAWRTASRRPRCATAAGKDADRHDRRSRCTTKATTSSVEFRDDGAGLDLRAHPRQGRGAWA